MSTSKLKPSPLGSIPEDWEVEELQDLVERIIDYRGKTPKKTNKGIPLVTAKVVKEGRINFDNPEYISEDDYDPWMKRGFPREGDVVVTTEAPLGEVAQLPEYKIALAQRIITLRGKRQVLSNDYLKYYLISSIGSYQLKSKETGSVVTGIKQKELRKILVLLPPLPTQHRIAEILSSLDDKIELNRKMNKTLESIAQAIFKEWFVDFRFPGHEKVKMVESEMGKIPEGWEVGSFVKLIEASISGDWGKEKSDKTFSEAVLCIRGTDILDLQMGNNGKMPVRYLKSKNFHLKKLIPGDLVVEISGGSPTQSTGRTLLVTGNLLNRFSLPLVCSNFCRVLRPKNRLISDFIYYYFDLMYKNDEFFQWENGTTGIKNLDIKSILNACLITYPPKDLLEGFSTQVLTLNDLIQSNGVNSWGLSQLRDALLPRLMSGRVRVNK